MILDRINDYDKNHCWQYDIRINNLDQDLLDSGITKDEAARLRVEDFDFRVVTDLEERERLKSFIKRHEWLGNLSQYTTDWFGCYYKDQLAGVILYSVPNAFSKLMGEGTNEIEKMISRGACISWSPKNLASSFLMWTIKWMARNTQYRLFTAYSDPSAKELGTIYQACNFYYLGIPRSSATKRYIHPYTGKLVSDRYFRQRSAYKKFAKELGIEWGKDWNHPTGMSWENVPDDVEKILREYSKKVQSETEWIDVPRKHKYAMVMGSNRSETKTLRKRFESMNDIYEYPKKRGE